jgi:hypothetical protein
MAPQFLTIRLVDRGETRMYTLMRLMPLRDVLLEQVPALMGALILAEVFYKFRSFTLECLAFLGTWYVLDAGIQFLRRVWRILAPLLRSTTE